MSQPKLIKNLYGHQQVFNKIMNDVNEGKKSSMSYLLSGKKGVGKASLVYAIAKELLDKQKIEQECEPDFIVIEKLYDTNKKKYKKEITINEVRKINRFLSLSSNSDKWRIVLVDSACEMNRNAANSILKILEEPPKKTLIFLLNHNGRLLPTIRSRCQKISLNNLKQEDIKNIIFENYQDAINIEPAKLDEIIEFSQGSAGLSFELLEQSYYNIFEQINDILNNLNSHKFKQLRELTDNMTKLSNGFKLVNLILQNFIVDKIKDCIRQNNTENIEQLFALRESFFKEVLDLEIFNLDQKSFIINKISTLKKL